MLIYMNDFDQNHRVVWAGGRSSMLRFHKLKDGQWHELDAMSYMYQVPDSVQGLKYDMCEYYNKCMTNLPELMYANG